MLLKLSSCIHYRKSHTSTTVNRLSRDVRCVSNLDRDWDAVRWKCLPLSGDFQSGPGRPVEEINARIDQLSRQVSSLEHSMASDIRLILSLLQQTFNSSKESSSIEMMQGTAPAGTRQSSRAPALVQRSASEPQPPTVPTGNGNGKIQPSTSHGLFRWEQSEEDPARSNFPRF